MIEAITARPWGDKSAPRHGDLRQVALFATPATVASRAFQRELSLRALGVDVEAQPCDGLVEAIEARDLAPCRRFGSRPYSGFTKADAYATSGGAWMHALSAGSRCF